jgi:prepilin-type N-terminal cleavage/methylation domain-containing protein
LSQKRVLKRTGFTLIELLIAIAIFTVIAAAIYSSFIAGIRVWNRSNSMIESFQSARVFFSVASTDLKNAVIFSPDSTNFSGTDSAMVFMSVVTAVGKEYMAVTELAKIAYYLDNSTKTLKRAVAAKAKGFDLNKADEIDIFTGVEAKDIRFEYCYKLSGSRMGYEWKDQWKDIRNIPIGVRIRAKGLTRYIFIPTGKIGQEEQA